MGAAISRNHLRVYENVHFWYLQRRPQHATRHETLFRDGTHYQGSSPACRQIRPSARYRDLQLVGYLLWPASRQLRTRKSGTHRLRRYFIGVSPILAQGYRCVSSNSRCFESAVLYFHSSMLFRASRRSLNSGIRLYRTLRWCASTLAVLWTYHGTRLAGTQIPTERVQTDRITHLTPAPTIVVSLQASMESKNLRWRRFYITRSPYHHGLRDTGAIRTNR
jgi:hypothetical protein